MSTSTGRAVDATAAIAFRLRVQRLEAILQGNSKVAADALNVNSGTAVRDIQDNDFRSLSRRLVDVDEALSQAIASSGHEGLKRFVNRCRLTSQGHLSHSSLILLFFHLLQSSRTRRFCSRLLPRHTRLLSASRTKAMPTQNRSSQQMISFPWRRSESSCLRLSRI